MKARGVAMGAEHRGKGIDVQLGPVAGQRSLIAHWLDGANISQVQSAELQKEVVIGKGSVPTRSSLVWEWLKRSKGSRVLVLLRAQNITSGMSKSMPESHLVPLPHIPQTSMTKQCMNSTYG
jgi:hypothetical protein